MAFLQGHVGGADDQLSRHGRSLCGVPGGTSLVLPDGSAFPSQLVWTAHWAKRNRCASMPVDSVVAPDVTRRCYGHCAHNADVVLYTIAGGGPHPPWFVGKMTNNIEASRIMWRFFYDHPFRR